jgi:hypothetical protein
MFMSIAIACVLTVRKQPVNKSTIAALRGEVAVFGDDIIVPSDSRELLFEALEVLHFKVNVQKSFWTGMFRESCGIDAFAGINVTPVYWKAPNDGKPASLDSTVEVSNNFYKKWLLNTSAVVSSTLPRDIPKVGMRCGAFGLKSRTSQLDNDLPSRWNEKLQRVEFKLCAKITRQHRTPIEDDSALLQYFTEEPSPYDMWTSGVPQRPLLKIQRRWVALSDLETQPDEKR